MKFYLVLVTVDSLSHSLDLEIRFKIIIKVEGPGEIKSHDGKVEGGEK